MAFMSVRDFTSMADPLIREGLETLQNFLDPEQIALVRRDAGGSFQTVNVFTPIDVRLANRLEQVTGQNAGIVEIVNGGTLRAFAPLDIRRDDRFTLNGQACIVTLVEDEQRGGVITANFRLMGG